jgi:hypothetical protein
MSAVRCERAVEGPDEASAQTCGRLATCAITSRLYGRSEWCACDKHATEAIRDGAEVRAFEEES